MDPSIALLTEIAQNTKQSPTWIVPLIVAVSTLLGLVIAAVLSYRLGVKKIQADVSIKKMDISMEIVSRERIRWLSEVRRLSSRFWHKNNVLIASLMNHLDHPPDTIQSDKVIGLMDVTSFLGYKLRVMLNDQRDDQKCMISQISLVRDIIDRAVNLDQNRKKEDEEAVTRSYQDARQAFFDSLQRVAMETWKQAKESK